VALLALLDVMADRARRLAQALGRLGQFQANLAAGELT